MRKIIGISAILVVAVLAIIVLAQSNPTLSGTVKLDGNAVNGSNVDGIVMLYKAGADAEIVEVSNSTISEDGTYSFSDVQDESVYVIKAYYINGNNLFISQYPEKDTLILNDSFITGFGFQSGSNITLINSSNAQYDINVEVLQ